MTNEEALKQLSDIRAYCEDMKYADDVAALDVAIEYVKEVEQHKDKLLNIIDAEAWHYIDYLNSNKKDSEIAKHISAFADNVRGRLKDECNCK